MRLPWRAAGAIEALTVYSGRALPASLARREEVSVARVQQTKGFPKGMAPLLDWRAEGGEGGAISGDKFHSFADAQLAFEPNAKRADDPGGPVWVRAIVRPSENDMNRWHAIAVLGGDGRKGAKGGHLSCIGTPLQLSWSGSRRSLRTNVACECGRGSARALRVESWLAHPHVRRTQRSQLTAASSPLLFLFSHPSPVQRACGVACVVAC